MPAPAHPTGHPVLWVDVVVVVLSLWLLWAAWLLLVYVACLVPTLWAWMRGEAPPEWVEPLIEWAEAIEWGPTDALADGLLWLAATTRDWVAWADETLPPTPSTAPEGRDDE